MNNLGWAGECGWSVNLFPALLFLHHCVWCSAVAVVVFEIHKLPLLIAYARLRHVVRWGGVYRDSIPVEQQGMCGGGRGGRNMQAYRVWGRRRMDQMSRALVATGCHAAPWSRKSGEGGVPTPATTRDTSSPRLDRDHSGIVRKKTHTLWLLQPAR